MELKELIFEVKIRILTKFRVVAFMVRSNCYREPIPIKAFLTELREHKWVDIRVGNFDQFYKRVGNNNTCSLRGRSRTVTTTSFSISLKLNLTQKGHLLETPPRTNCAKVHQRNLLKNFWGEYRRLLVMIVHYSAQRVKKRNIPLLPQTLCFLPH